MEKIAYIIEGYGRLIAGGKEINLNKNDLILIEPEEKCFWEGNLVIFIHCVSV